MLRAYTSAANDACKASMLRTPVTSSPFDALSSVTCGATTSSNEPHLFCKELCFTFQFSFADIWLSQLKA